jgi:hypothetical protein
MRYILNAAFLFITLQLFSSCESDFLDAKPDKALLVPATLRDYQALLDNSNAIMNRTPYLSEVASDDFSIADNTIQGFSETEQNCYRWDKHIYYGFSNTDWDIPYRQIFYSNVVLDGLKGIDSPSNDPMYRNIKGMALFRRAWGLYQAVQVFTEGYNPQNANTKLGLPVRTSSDVSQIAGRSSLSETYVQILSDLTQAIPLLDLEQDVPTRPSKTAAYAFMARVCLTMQNYDKAKLYADSTLNIYNQLLDYNTLDTTLPFAMPNIYSTSNRHPEVIFLTILIPNSFLGTSNVTFASNELYDSYSDGDLRKSIFFNASQLFTGSYIGTQLYQFSGLAVDEVFLIRAEANVRIGNITRAMDDLNMLLLNRYKKGQFESVTSTNPVELLGIILDERRKELVGRGIRWSDLKRINQDGLFAKKLIRIIDGKEVTLPPLDKRYVFPIPDNEIAVNGIEQNER